MPVCERHFVGCGTALQDTVYVLNQQLMYGAVCPKVWIHVSGKQGVEVELGSLAIISELPWYLSGK